MSVACVPFERAVHERELAILSFIDMDRGDRRSTHPRPFDCADPPHYTTTSTHSVLRLLYTNAPLGPVFKLTDSASPAAPVTGGRATPAPTADDRDRKD